MALDAKALWEQVKADSKARRACPRHHYAPRTGGYGLGEKLTCSVCGVADRLTDIGRYIEGYKAAGGDPHDIMPDWTSHDRPH